MNWIILVIAVSLNALTNILIKIGVMDKGDKVNIKMLIEVITTPTISEVLPFQGFSPMNTKGFLRRTREDTSRNGVSTGSLTDIEMG